MTTPAQANLLDAIDHASFVWDVASDAMTWSGNASAVLTSLPASALASGTAFGALIEPMQSLRHDAIQAACENPQDGKAAYRITYGIRATTSAPLVWLEESAVCDLGDDGKPLRVRGLLHVDADRHAHEAELLRLARCDQLTGGLSRTYLIDVLGEAIEDATRVRQSLCFLLVGIDHLASINDAFGFEVGDQVIRKVAKRVRDRLRGGDVIGRFSGNKLGVILKNCTAEDYSIAAERFLAAIRDSVVVTPSAPVAVTATIGAVMAPRHARDVTEALNRAQESLVIAKRRRRGSAAIWQPSVERDAKRRLNIRVTDEIVTALNERSIVPAFEPVMDTRTGVPAFHECLVRMRQEDGRVMLAPDIVPVAERLGLIRLVDHRMLDLVIDELAAHPDISLSLNISPETTRDPDWWSAIESMMRATPGVGERLIVEITETVAIQDVDDVRGFVTRLKNFGGRIAIDDFGAGYTSFRNLRKLGVDILKIDGDFVKNLASSADDRAFVQSLIDLTRRLGIKSVAEWVQDEASATLLRDWGCDYIQGHYVGLASSQRPWDNCAAVAKS